MKTEIDRTEIRKNALHLARDLFKNLTPDNKQDIALGTYDYETEDMAQLLIAWVDEHFSEEDKAATIQETFKHIRGMSKFVTFYAAYVGRPR